MNGHEAARLRAQKMVDNPKMFNRDNLALATCYLELVKLAEAVVKDGGGYESIKALREILME